MFNIIKSKHISTSQGGIIMNDIYDMKTLLEIIFKYTKKNARILADQYLIKDVSIISKWKNNVIYPKNDDIFRIVEFVNNESTFSQKELIRDNIEELLKKAPIKSKIKDIIIRTEDFSEFLKEAISVSMSAYEDNNALFSCEEEIRTGSIIKKDRKSGGKGTYSGTVELDFNLPEGEDINLQKLAMGKGIEFKGILNLIPKKKAIKVTNFFKSSTALGVLLICLIPGTIIAFAVGISSNNQSTSKNNTMHNKSIEAGMVPNASSTKSCDEYSTPALDEKSLSISGAKDIDTQNKEELLKESEEVVSSPTPQPSHLPEAKEEYRPAAIEDKDTQKENNTINNKINNIDNSSQQNKSNNINKSSQQNTTNNINNSSQQNTNNNVNNGSQQNTTNNTEVNSWNNFSIQISGENHSLVVGEENAVSIEND